MGNDGKLSFLTKVSITDNHCISPDIYHMKIAAPDAARSARAGQFIMVYLDKGELLLPRPISIYDANETEIEIVYQVVGKGTKALSQMRAQQEIKILAPLGNGFAIPGTGTKAALVGGGIGTPPLHLLAKTLKSKGISVDVYLGFRDTAILEKAFQNIADNVRIKTEGFITDLISPQNYDQIFACGPEPMLRTLAAKTAVTATPTQVSMEQRMACGIGTCVGCVIKVGEQYTRVCKEGPVFDATEVFPQ